MQNNLGSKSNLAKLLATENINVSYEKVETASFNVGSRTLTLPIIDDMTNDMQDLFIGHEVGHALFTPTTYGDVQKGMPRGFGTFLNVVEDARIERDIKDRYPGLKKSFAKGYGDFMRQDFFQVRGKDLDRLLLIDRINLHFKIGAFCNIGFTEQELNLRNKVENCQTFDEVVAVSKELFEYCKQELEDKKEEDRQEYGDLSGDEYDDFDFDDDMMGSGLDGDPDDDATETQKEFKQAKPKDSFPDDAMADILSPEVESYNDEVKSVTDEKLQDALRKLATTNKDIIVGNLHPSDLFEYNKIIVPYKKLLGKLFSRGTNEVLRALRSAENNDNLMTTDILSEFEKKNKNAILYLVKEFELRKKAAENLRTVISDTGVLDTNKLHTYKFNDDIFRKIGSVPSGKNHGIVIFLDWSGSMIENMHGTMEQVLTLVSFCQKIKVPYEVYAFSTEYCKHAEEYYAYTPMQKPANDFGGIYFGDRFNLLNLLSSKMSSREFRTMANDLLVFSKVNNNHFGRFVVNNEFRLGGTPLNVTIVAASEIVNRFRKTYKTEIVNVAFMTDGEDSSYLSLSESWKTVRESTYQSQSYVNDLETKKRYKVGPLGVTPTLLQILKDRSGCNLIGFYILTKSKREFSSAFSRLCTAGSMEESFSKFKEDKFLGILDYGYDEYFLIPGGSDLSTDSEDLDDLLGENNTAVSARKLRGAFLKMNRGRLTNRVLLSKMIEKIA